MLSFSFRQSFKLKYMSSEQHYVLTLYNAMNKSGLSLLYSKDMILDHSNWIVTLILIMIYVMTVLQSF